MGVRIKKGDKVVVIAGKDKGKAGKLLKMIAAKNHVIVEGVGLAKKHIRKRSESERGGIKEIPTAIHVSNVSLFCSNCNRGVRFEVKMSDDKSKARICKKCHRPL